MKMIQFVEASSSNTIYVNPAQVIYCVPCERRSSEGQLQSNICFLKGRDVTVIGTVDDVAAKLMSKQDDKPRE